MPSRLVVLKSLLKADLQNYRWLRIASVLLLTLLLSAWDTCSVSFVSCQGVVAKAQVTSLSPGAIPGDANSVPLIVVGSGFTPHSQVLWNGSDLATTFMDSHHLQTTITHETFAAFGGSAGSSVRVSVRPQMSGGLGCPIVASSAALDLIIN
jgi:hypothetical protein